MKRKSNSRSAFFNRCALVVLAGVAGAFFALLSLFGNPAAAGGNSAGQSATGRINGGEPKQKSLQGQTGTLEKMIVASCDSDSQLRRRGPAHGLARYLA